MVCQASFDQGLMTIMPQRSPLSQPQATVLALWSFGMVLARSCALTAVRQLLAQGMKRHEQTVRQQWREWYYDWICSHDTGHMWEASSPQPVLAGLMRL
jgi:hypothetical protein